MKQFINPLLVLSLLVSLTACGGGESSPSQAQLESIRVELTDAPVNPDGLQPKDVEVDKTLKYTAIGEYDDGSKTDISTDVTWNSSDEGVLVVTGGGSFYTKNVGPAQVNASLDGQHGSADLTVVEPIKVTITEARSPLGRKGGAVSVPRGLSVNYSATIEWSNMETTQGDNSVEWKLDSSDVFKPKSDNSHTFRAVGDVGNTVKLSAYYKGVNSNVDKLIVDVAELQSITLGLSGHSPQVPRGQSIGVSAQGIFLGSISPTESDTYQEDVTDDVNWISSNDQAFSNMSGSNHFIAVGDRNNTGVESNIRASLSSYENIISQDITLVVADAELIKVIISPVDDQSTKVPEGFSITFQAYGVYKGNSGVNIFNEDITTEVNWNSDNPAFTQDLQDSNKFKASGSKNDSANITAEETVQHLTSVSTKLVIDEAKLESIQLNLLYTYPMDVPQLQSRDFEAIGTFRRGDNNTTYTQNITDKITWVQDENNFICGGNQCKAAGLVGSSSDIYTTYKNSHVDIESNHFKLSITDKYAEKSRVSVQGNEGAQYIIFEHPPLGVLGGDGTIYENTVGWAIKTWDHANAYCISQERRLPTIAELTHLDFVNKGSIEAVLGWPSTSDRYWSSTASDNGHISRSMEIGGASYDDSNSSTHFVTCISGVE